MDDAKNLFNDPIDYQAIEEMWRHQHENTRMPFGKHKGTPITKVPTPYLAWLRARLHEREEEEGSPLFQAVEYEWEARFGEDSR